jgi:serine/threonine-protein kinase
MKLKITTLFFLATMVASCQTKLEKYSKDNYTISYPKNWKMNTSGQMGSEFIIFSEIEKNETFRENVNLLTQDLKGQSFTLKSFAEMSKNQIKNTVPNSTIIESKIVDSASQPYYILVWKGKIGPNELQLKQQIYIKEEKAYIISFTALPESYARFAETADKIFNSFILN